MPAPRAVSIKARLALAVGLVFLAVIVLGGTLQIALLRADFKGAILREREGEVTRIAADIDTRIDTARRVLQQTAAGFAGAPGPEPARVREALSRDPALAAFFDDVLLVDRGGIVRADWPVVPGRVGIDASDRAFIRESLATGRAVISEPLMSRVRKEPVVQVAVPVMGDEGPLAVLVGVIRLYGDNFLGSLVDARIGERGYYVLLTRGARPVYVTHPDRSRILMPRPSNSARAITRALGGNEGSDEDITSTGVPSLYSSRLLHAVPWVLVGVVPQDQAFAPLARAERRLLLVAAAVSVVLLVLFWLLVRSALRPLERLRDRMASMRDEPPGHFPLIPVARHDEVGDLTLAFNELMRERGATAQALAQSEARLRLLADNLPALVAYFDRDLRVRYANRMFLEWLGVDPEHLAGRRAGEFLGMAESALEPRMIERALAGEANSFEADIAMRGATRAVRTVLLPDRDEAGEVRGVYSVTSDISEDKRIRHELALQARRDPLTGAWNRLGLQEALPAAIARAHRVGRRAALIFIDLDGFKSVNDTLGHAAGDEVLQRVAARLAEAVRVSDIVARYGGDEFAVVLEGLREAEEAEGVARKMLAMLEEPMATAAGTCRIGASIGVAVAGGASITADDLLEAADAACYEAKRRGKGRYHVADVRAPRPDA